MEQKKSRQKMYRRLYDTLQEKVKNPIRLRHVEVLVLKFFAVPQHPTRQYFAQLKKSVSDPLSFQTFSSVLSQTQLLAQGLIPEGVRSDGVLNKLPMKVRKSLKEKEKELVDEPDFEQELKQDEMRQEEELEQRLQNKYSVEENILEEQEEQDEILNSSVDNSIQFQIIKP